MRLGSFAHPLARVSVRGPTTSEAEEQEPVPLAARYLLGDGRQGLIAPVLELEALVENLHHDIAAPELARQQSAG